MSCLCLPWQSILPINIDFISYFYLVYFAVSHAIIEHRIMYDDTHRRAFPCPTSHSIALQRGTTRPPRVHLLIHWRGSALHCTLGHLHHATQPSTLPGTPSDHRKPFFPAPPAQATESHDRALARPSPRALPGLMFPMLLNQTDMSTYLSVPTCVSDHQPTRRETPFSGETGACLPLLPF